MSNIATSIVQSKHLLELGLDPKTADMYYLPQVMNEGETLWPIDEGYDLDDADQPAWSLSALLEVMPKVIVHDMDKHVLCFKYDADGVAPFMYYVVENGRNKGKLIRFDNGRCAPDAADALDAAYQMVCWLLRNNLIEKGEKDGN